MYSETISPAILQKAFPGMNEDEANEMLTNGKIVEFPTETVICREGAFETHFYIIIKGEVEVTKVINDADVRILNHLSPGDFFGEMAIIHKAPRTATITAIQETSALEMDEKAFNYWLNRSASMSMAMLNEVSKRLRDNDEMAIDSLRKKNKELALAYQKLAEEEKARSEFLSTIAHELRTPLTAASGFLQIIQSGNIQGEYLDSALDTVSRNIQEIISLTNDILFLQEMELILPKFTPTDIGSVIASAVEKQHLNAEKNKIGLRLDLAPGLPRIPADSKSLERAIGAILDNAIKFSPESEIVQISTGFQDPEYWIKIQDKGVGIPEDLQGHIFERFFHISEIEGRLFRGAGLGLSIAQQVIKQHNGSIEVNSKKGEGSCFTIKLQKKAGGL